MNQPTPSPQPELSTNCRLRAFLKLCIALLAISCAPILIRFSETDLGANGTVLNRLLIFAVVFGSVRVGRSVAAPKTDSEPEAPISWQLKGLLLGVGVISVLSLVLWAMSLQHISVAKSMLLNNLTPIFTTLGGWALFKKQVSARFLVGMAISLCGALALGLEDVQGITDNLVGDLYAVLSAVFLGLYFLMVEQLRQRFGATTILLSRAIVGSLVLLPIAWFTEGQVFPTTASAWLAAIGLGILCEGFGQRLLADAMDQLSSSFIALFLLLEPIISAILAWGIFAEQLSPLTWVGFGVVLTGIYISTATSSASKVQKPAATVAINEFI